VVEVYTTPYEAYDIEIVTDEGQTKGLLEAVRPGQIEVAASDWAGMRFAPAAVRFTSIRIEAAGTHAAVSFSEQFFIPSWHSRRPHEPLP